MRKLSCKWPVWLTLFAFIPVLPYVFVRILRPEPPNTADLAQFDKISQTVSPWPSKVVGAIGISIIVWVVYGIACLFARTWVNCGNCEFSDVIQDSKEMKCRLTGYNYPITYSCKNSKPKEVEVAKDSQIGNR